MIFALVRFWHHSMHPEARKTFQPLRFVNIIEKASMCETSIFEFLDAVYPAISKSESPLLVVAERSYFRFQLHLVALD
jgi:hypothetical protein